MSKRSAVCFGLGVVMMMASPAWGTSPDVSCLDASLGPKPTKVTGAERRALLEGHNDARRKLGHKPLVWDDKLARHAQGWADVIAEHNRRKAAGEPLRLPGGMGVHSNGSCYSKRYGQKPENIISGGATAAAAIKGWIHDEKPHYDEKARVCRGGECGHYVQAIAYNVSRIGCGHNRASSLICTFDAYGGRKRNGKYMEPLQKYLSELKVGGHYTLTQAGETSCVQVKKIGPYIVEWTRGSGGYGTADRDSLGKKCTPAGGATSAPAATSTGAGGTSASASGSARAGEFYELAGQGCVLVKKVAGDKFDWVRPYGKRRTSARGWPTTKLGKPCAGPATRYAQAGQHWELPGTGCVTITKVEDYLLSWTRADGARGTADRYSEGKRCTPAGKKPAPKPVAKPTPPPVKPAIKPPVTKKAPDCRSPEHEVDEAKNTLGSNRCSSDCECDGARTCSSAGWCGGTSR